MPVSDPIFWSCVKVFPLFRKTPGTFNFLRHVLRAIFSVRPKCSHKCVSLNETSLKPVHIIKHTTKNSTEQTAVRTKWFKHIAIKLFLIPRSRDRSFLKLTFFLEERQPTTTTKRVVCVCVLFILKPVSFAYISILLFSLLFVLKQPCLRWNLLSSV